MEALSFIIPVSLTHVSFTSSGSAAVDLAITWVASASDRSRIIAMQRSDHGSGIGGRGVSAGRRLGEIAGRSLEVLRVPFDDLEALRAQLDHRVAAVIVEPVQVEAGIRIPAPGYLASVAELCRGAGALLVVDEVRTALRMGPTLASAARGSNPTSCASVRRWPMACRSASPPSARRSRGARGSRRGDHEVACPPLVCAAANATIRTALGPTLRTLAALTSERLHGRLRGLRLGEIREVRGSGAMVAVETSLNGPMLLRRLEQRGILALPAGTGSVRMLAPLILERREADSVVEALAAIILASRPPRRRSMPAHIAEDVEVVLPGTALRRRTKVAL